MAIRLVFAAAIWLFLFSFRILQIGGIDPTYQEKGNQALKPLQDHLARVLEKTSPYPQSSLLEGILIGVGQRIPFALKKELQATSTIHIVVVSGQNLTILAGFLISLAGFLGRKKTIFLTLLVVVFYSLLTGLQIPVLRAAIMALLAYLAQLLGKERQGIWVLALTGGLMLLFNPNWLLSISFQLSFLATLGVVVLAPVFVDKLQPVPQILRQDLAMTLSAQLLTLPVIAFNFHQLSLFGILVNSLILWTVPLVMVSGFITLGLGLVSSFLGQLASLIPSVLLTYFIYIVEFFAKFPGASVSIGESSIVFWVGYYLLVGAGVWMLSKSQSSNRKT